jgi:putative oxidoreductase
MRNSTRVTLWVFSALLAALFVAAGIAKFVSPVAQEQFARWGYASWFRVLVGLLEIGCGAALLAPRLAWRAALVLGVLMLGVAGTLWFHGDTINAIGPTVVLLIVSIVGYARHPRATLMHRLQSAVDWVAERELEEQRKKIAVHQAMKTLKRPVGNHIRGLAKGSSS